MAGRFAFPNSGRFSRGNMMDDGNAGFLIAINEFFGNSAILAPVISVKSHSLNSISDEAGMTTCVIVFSANLQCDQWEARATYGAASPGLGVGSLVGSGGSLAANIDANFNVDYDELINGDGNYTITVYGHNEAGWSSA